MVGLEELDALDLLLWLGRGADAASRLGCNQSTVSRRSSQCLQVFDLKLHKDAEGEFCTRRHALLNLEREVHQLQRLRAGKRLRLEASLLAAPLLRADLPSGWISGHLDGLGWQRPLFLLEERICDAWVTAMGQELPEHAVQNLRCIPLLRTPLLLAADRTHPLLNQGTLQLTDLSGFPRLAPRPGLYPRTEQLLGRWRQHRAPLQLEATTRRQGTQSRAVASEGNGRPLHYGTAFSLAQQTTLQPLDLDLGVQTELSLVVRRDLENSEAIAQLAQALQKRALQAALADQGLIGLN